MPESGLQLSHESNSLKASQVKKHGESPARIRVADGVLVRHRSAGFGVGWIDV